MTPLRQKMMEDMTLRGLSPKTQRAYVRVVRDLAAYYDRSPDQIEEEELRAYFLYLQQERVYLEAAAPLLSVASSSSTNTRSSANGPRLILL